MRDRQRVVLNEIDAALSSGYKRIFFEAPTGFGKSPVAVSLALYLGSSHFCTATKDLQTQYSRDFPFISEVTGRGNFPCIIKEEMGLTETCDFGPCVRDDAYDCVFKTRLADYSISGAGTKSERIVIDPAAMSKYSSRMESRLVKSDWRPCHYFDQKWRGARSSHTIYNYRYFLSDIFFSGSSQKRNLLVLDEAHRLESEVSDFKSFSVSRNSIGHIKVKMPDAANAEDIETWIEFCIEAQERLDDFIEKASGILESSKQKVPMEPYTEHNLIQAIERESQLAAAVADMKSNKENWIVSSLTRDDDDGGTIQRVVLTPLDVSGYFGPILDKGNVALFMSATILSKEYLCRVTGIEEDTVKFVRVAESDIPLQNRPIFLENVAWLNARTMNESMPAIAAKVGEIMNRHANEKGIIHTTSYSQLEAIKGRLDSKNASRLIETGKSIDRREALRRHYESARPTVLISPSLHLGLDLKDDLSRFQIIVKVPYPDLNDKKIAALKQRDPKWYLWHTVLRMVQSYGRSVRGPQDRASTYVLDKSVKYLLDGAGEMVPKWFSDAIRKP